jgi:uncharacterized protein
MTDNILNWAKRIAPQIQKFLSFSKNDPSIKSVEISTSIINKKIWEKFKKNEMSVSYYFYDDYFLNLRSLGLLEDFEIKTSNDNITLRGSVIKHPIINSNNNKTIIFCHGLTSNRWSLFYQIHLVLQLGYQVIIYDARNHGMSQSSYTTLGKIESLDLEDIVKWVIKKYKPEKLGFYGFSMGSATLLFWIGQFQEIHPEVAFIICEAPFDDFKERFQGFLGLEIKDRIEKYAGWKHYFFHTIAMKILNSPFDISEISPILSLPEKLKIKLLLLHGFKDTAISWKSSFNIWRKLNEKEENKGMVNLYLFDEADHGDVAFFGDFFPNSVHWAEEMDKVSKFSFSSLLSYFLNKNF